MSNNTVISQIDVAKAMLATAKTLGDYIALINSNDGMYQVALEMNDNLAQRFSLYEMSWFRKNGNSEKMERLYRVFASRLEPKDDFQELKERVVHRYGIEKYDFEQQKRNIHDQDCGRLLRVYRNLLSLYVSRW